MPTLPDEDKVNLKKLDDEFHERGNDPASHASNLEY